MTEITEKVRALLEPITSERGYFVLEMSYKREGAQFALRIVLDRDGGITMGECAQVNSELSELLDKDDTITERYLIEVSSPGLDRKLKTDRDFMWAVGKDITVSTYAPLDGKNAFRGTLLGLGDGTVVINENGISAEIPRKKVASARLTFSGE